MPKSVRRFQCLLRALFAALAIGYSATAWALANQGGFIATLSTEQVNATGISALTDAQRAALDQFVQSEVAQARQTGSTELEGTFTARRNDTERQRAGLDQLSPEQLKKLDGLVATAVASSPKPKERPRLRDSDVFNPASKPEVHGQMSLTYGHTSGRGDFRGASMWVDYFDPKTGLSLGIGISRYSGPGLVGCGYFPGYYEPGLGYYGYDAGFGFPDAFYERPMRGPVALDIFYSESSGGMGRSPAFYRDFRRN